MIFRHTPLSSPELQPLLSSINAVGWVFSPVVALCFVLAFSEREWIFRTKWFWVVFLGVPGILLYSQFTGKMAVKYVLNSYGWYGVFGNTFWSYAFLAYELACIAALLILSFLYIKKCDTPARRTQAKIVFASLLLSAIPISINTLANIIFKATNIPELESIFILFFCCGIVYAMSRYRFLDITPSLAAESIISSMPSGLLLLDIRGIMVFTNQQMRSMLGVPHGAKLDGQHVSQLLHEDQMVEELQNEILNGVNFRNREISLKTWDGSSLPVSLSRSLLQDQDGQPAGIVCLATDLTLTRAKEMQLRESEEKYRDLVENINEVVYSLAKDGSLIYVNPRIRTLMGYHPDELLGQDFSRFIHPADLDEVLQRFQDVLAGYAWSHEFRVLDKTGEIRWVYSSNRPSRKDDLIIGVQGTLMDVTGRRKSEEEKLRLETDLRRSQKMEAIGTLAGGIAHNFNNILYPIMGYAEMALEDLPQDNPVRDEVEGILNATHRAKELVKQILAFSHVTKESFHPQDPRPILEDAVTFIKGVLPSTIRVVTYMEEDPGYIVGDRAQIHQMLMNLCTNAYQAMASKGGLLKLRLEKYLPSSPDEIPGLPSRNGAYVKFSVIDSGEGMSQDVLDRIFDPYFTTKPVGEGTGMGLAVTHAMVEKHGGTIQVISKQGKGTQFDILFPASSRTPQVEAPQDTMEKPLGSGERILLVEDEKAVRNVTRRALERLGYNVIEARDGLKAWDLFQGDPGGIDLVLTDLTMPGLTGEGLATRIYGVRPDLPIVLISGFNEPEEDAGEMLPGVWARVMKPLEQNQLAKVVRYGLDHACNLEQSC